jgi:hypothetical protein
VIFAMTVPLAAGKAPRLTGLEWAVTETFSEPV